MLVSFDAYYMADAKEVSMSDLSQVLSFTTWDFATINFIYVGF